MENKRDTAFGIGIRLRHRLVDRKSFSPLDLEMQSRYRGTDIRRTRSSMILAASVERRTRKHFRKRRSSFTLADRTLSFRLASNFHMICQINPILLLFSKYS